MIAPKDFYISQIDIFSRELAQVKRQLHVSSTIRLLVFVGVIASIYFLWGQVLGIILAVVFGIAIFLFLVTRHSKLQYERDLIKAQILLNETELLVLDRNYYDLPDGKEYENPEHSYSHDIDLFGRGSFFQYLNRTGLKAGADVLTGLLTENEITEIELKQEAVKELSALPKWRQRFTAIARLVKTETSADTVVDWIETYQPILPSYCKKISIVYSLVSLTVGTLYVLGLISGWWLLGCFGIGSMLLRRYGKSIGVLSDHLSKVQSVFTQYARLIHELEEQDFKSITLMQKRQNIISQTSKSSLILKKFSKHLDAFDQRNNLLMGPVANGFFLRDFITVSNIEKWIMTHKHDVAVWFEIIAFFDAYNSLGNYAYNHPEQVYPEIVSDATAMEAKAACHPLLNPEVAINNDYKIFQEQFFIVTGANMAGKSTFLRMVALQIVMSNIGLPVCAKASRYHPTKLITSMRTTDSLTDDESYFFSELKRLKFIVEEIKTERYFIILDEILKGTNSTDKAIGSRKFVDKLVASGATGIIATHDLSLCSAADDLEAVENYYFDARIENDELYFDYTFKKGICQNMNASFLLKKMEIV